jgi:hypothetical protein
MPQRVNPGDKIRASEYNEVVNQANASSRVAGSSGTLVTSNPSGVTVGKAARSAFPNYAFHCLATNVGTELIGQYRPAVIHNVSDGQLFEVDNPYLQTNMVLKVRRSDQIADAGHPWVIAKQDIAPNTFGRVCTMGITLAYIYRYDDFGDATFQQAEYMTSHDVLAPHALMIRRDGPAQVLWKEPGAGITLGIVRVHGSNAWQIANLDIDPTQSVQNNSFYTAGGVLYWLKPSGESVRIS